MGRGCGCCAAEIETLKVCVSAGLTASKVAEEFGWSLSTVRKGMQRVRQGKSLSNYKGKRSVHDSPANVARIKELMDGPAQVSIHGVAASINVSKSTARRLLHKIGGSVCKKEKILSLKETQTTKRKTYSEQMLVRLGLMRCRRMPTKSPFRHMKI